MLTAAKPVSIGDSFILSSRGDAIVATVGVAVWLIDSAGEQEGYHVFPRTPGPIVGS